MLCLVVGLGEGLEICGGVGSGGEVEVGGEVRVGLELSEAKRVIKKKNYFFYIIFERTKIPLGLCKILHIGVEGGEK